MWVQDWRLRMTSLRKMASAQHCTFCLKRSALVQEDSRGFIVWVSLNHKFLPRKHQITNVLTVCFGLEGALKIL